MTKPSLHVVVPGALDQCTGGYIYEAHMVEGLRGLGWRVDVHNLSGGFPESDSEARSSLASTLSLISDGARVVIDGLAMGGLPELVQAESDRLRILALVHHPLADETGIEESQRRRLETLERNGLAACVGKMCGKKILKCVGKSQPRWTTRIFLLIFVRPPVAYIPRQKTGPRQKLKSLSVKN